jgi:hypothetical protein
MMVRHQAHWIRVCISQSTTATWAGSVQVIFQGLPLSVRVRIFPHRAKLAAQQRRLGLRFTRPTTTFKYVVRTVRCETRKQGRHTSYVAPLSAKGETMKRTGIVLALVLLAVPTFTQDKPGSAPIMRGGGTGIAKSQVRIIGGGYLCEQNDLVTTILAAHQQLLSFLLEQNADLRSQVEALAQKIENMQASIDDEVAKRRCAENEQQYCNGPSQ